MSFDIPVLFIAFNRPDYTSKVFDAIKKANPNKLYVCVDGPRDNNENDSKNCELVKNIVCDTHGMTGEVFFLFREENLGCKKSVSDAISWLFSNEEMGIILEDDCLPDASFFKFIRSMLYFYKNDERVGVVSGTNLYSSKFQYNNESYFYSRNINIWGWGSWRRVWDKYDLNLESWRDTVNPDNLKHLIPDPIVRRYYEIIFDKMKNKEIDTWDYQLFYLCLFNNLLSVVPVLNLISNIGVDGTHSASKTGNHFMQSFEISDTLVHPKNVTPNIHFDMNFFKKKLYMNALTLIVKENIRKVVGPKLFAVGKKWKNKI
jgi:hypothetical protein